MSLNFDRVTVDKITSTMKDDGPITVITTTLIGVHADDIAQLFELAELGEVEMSIARRQMTFGSITPPAVPDKIDEAIATGMAESDEVAAEKVPEVVVFEEEDEPEPGTPEEIPTAPTRDTVLTKCVDRKTGEILEKPCQPDEIDIDCARHFCGMGCAIENGVHAKGCKNAPK